MGYVIVTDSRVHNEVLFMVNRRKQRASFWSNRLDDNVFVYKKKKHAEMKVAQLQFNNPRVMTYEEARTLVRVQEETRNGR